MTIRENLAYLRHFGPWLTFWKTVNASGKRKRNRLTWKIHDINNAVIEQYLKKVCRKTYQAMVSPDSLSEADKIRIPVVLDQEQSEGLKNNCIWTMWWQGEENAPALVRACIACMRTYGNGHPVVVIDQNNIHEYIELPKLIWERFREYEQDKSCLKKIGLDRTKLSNIVRLALLSAWGGVWADATILFTADVEETLFTDEFSTLGQDNPWYIGRGRWSTFFMGCRAGCPLIKYVYQMHLEYWAREKYFVNYLMFDHMIDVAYKELPGGADLIDQVSTGNKECITINRRYNQAVDVREFEAFLERQHFHKLSWKWGGSEKEAAIGLRTAGGELTWYGYLYENYMEAGDRKR